MSVQIHELTEETFDRWVADSRQPVVIDFWAAWCGPCRAIAPTVESLSREYAGEVRFAKVDVDQNPGLANRFGIRSIPALLLIDGNQVIGMSLGNKPAMELSEWIERAIAPAALDRIDRALPAG